MIVQEEIYLNKFICNFSKIMDNFVLLLVVYYKLIVVILFFLIKIKNVNSKFSKKNKNKNKILVLTSSQDGGIGKRGLPPHTITSKLQLKHTTTITQNHQKLSGMEA